MSRFGCQGCFTYRAIDPANPELIAGGKYKIKQGPKTKRVRLVAITDSLLMVKYRGDTIPIQRSKITEIKHGKFSWTKTILYPIGIYLGTIALFFGLLFLTW